LDPIKLLIFAGVFVLLLVLGRIVSVHSESRISQEPLAPEGQSPDGSSIIPTRRSPAATGAEIGFPIVIPPVTRNQQGQFNRPYFLNYYFEKTDLVAGPPGPDCFCDEFHLLAQNPEDEHLWEYQYTVATPSGLQQLMKKEGFSTLYLDSQVVVVSRWDLPAILQTVVEEIMKSYSGESSEAAVNFVREPDRWA
jgi:hypothetical protein